MNIHTSFQAAAELLVGDGNVKPRLCRAYERYLAPLQEEELPPSVRDRFDDLRAALHRESPVGARDRLHATVQKMSAFEASHYAVEILRMYGALSGADEALPARRINDPIQFPSRAAASAPRFLSKA